MNFMRNKIIDFGIAKKNMVPQSYDCLSDT